MRGNVFIYTAAALVTAGFSFLSVTVLTHLLSKSDFGIIENFTAIGALITAFMMWGSSTTLVSYYSDKNQDQLFVNAFRGILLQFFFFHF